jgi:hypothetical protein
MRAIVWCSTLLAIAILGMSAAGDAGAQANPPNEVPECISVRGEARYGAYGYDHVVVVASRCEEVATCRVATDVDPAEVVVRVPAGATRETVTRRGSPSRAFTPRVGCELER